MLQNFVVYFRDGEGHDQYKGESCSFVDNCKCWQIRHRDELCVTIPKEVIKQIVAKKIEEVAV